MANYIRVVRHSGDISISLHIRVRIEDMFDDTIYLHLRGNDQKYEDQNAKKFVDKFLKKYKTFKNLRSKLLDHFKTLHNIGDRYHTKNIFFSLNDYNFCVPCAKISKGGCRTRKNEVSQTELKQKLKFVDKGSDVLKVFVGNKCCVCLSNYKEILDEDLHIVVPFCGHPLCSKCADNILDSKKKECPQCRGKITAQSFNLMKFNADLEIDTENQNVFL